MSDDKKAWEQIHAHTEAHIQKVIESGECERCVKFGYPNKGKPTVRLNYSSFFIVCESCNGEMNNEWAEHWKEVEEELAESRKEDERHRRVMEFYEENGYYPGAGFE